MACLLVDLSAVFSEKMWNYFEKFAKQLHLIDSEFQMNSITLQNLVRILDIVVEDASGRQIQLALVRDVTASLVRLAPRFYSNSKAFYQLLYNLCRLCQDFTLVESLVSSFKRILVDGNLARSAYEVVHSCKSLGYFYQAFNSLPSKSSE